jgi:predicted esterase
VAGSLVAMSVFHPDSLPALTAAKDRAFYIYHCPQDQVCPFADAEAAKKSLTENGAKVKLATYPGGHGWTGPVYPDLRQGFAWLEQNGQKPVAP